MHALHAIPLPSLLWSSPFFDSLSYALSTFSCSTLPPHPISFLSIPILSHPLQLESKSRMSSIRTRCLDNSILSPVPPALAPIVVQLQGDSGERVEGRRRVGDMRGINVAGRKEASNKCLDGDMDGNQGGDGCGDDCTVLSGGRAQRSPHTRDSVRAKHSTPPDTECAA
jgi:hypothetical protein